MKISILCKIILLLVLSILITGTAIFFTARYFMAEGFEYDAQNNLKKTNDIVDGEIKKIQDLYIDSSRLMADNVALSEAIVKKDDKTISLLLKHNMKTSGAQFITLADKDGKVIMRSHSSKRGDSITNQSVFRHAIQGQSCVNIERGTAIKFSLRAASPIYHDNKIIAAIVIGEALDTNRFVDNVKKITGLEMTIFEGNTRISTTLLNNGQRAIGTKLSNEKVLDAVLMRGETLTSNAILFDRPYKTVYWPLVDNFTHDKLGMWFIGLDHSMVQKTIDNIAFSCIVAIAIIFLVISIFGIVFSRALIVPLKKCVQFAINVANGSLKEELTVQRNDEVGELANALRTLLASLRTMIDEAQKATREAEEKNKLAEQATAEAKKAAVMAENAKRDGMLDAALKLDDMVTAISAAAAQLSTQIEQSDQSALESSERLAEAAELMNKMNASVQEVAQNASNASSVSTETRNNAVDGQKILSNALDSINDVQSVSMQLKEDMNQLHAHTRDISRIMDVISDIADQTNLLALNAAIEAARAGEAGRGFAVVADEVRKLAEKTMASTSDVSKAITAIQHSAEQSANRMEQALGSVYQATDLAQHSGKALEQIVLNVEKTADQVRAIAMASEEQSSSSEEITQSIMQVTSMSSDTTAAMGKAAKAITNLTQQTNNLSTLIAQMKAS